MTGKSGEALNPMSGELLDLANRYCDQQLTTEEASRLNDLLRQDSGLVALFVEFVQLHGQLAWDAGHGTLSGRMEPATEDILAICSEPFSDSKAQFSKQQSALKPAARSEATADLSLQCAAADGRSSPGGSPTELVRSKSERFRSWLTATAAACALVTTSILMWQSVSEVADEVTVQVNNTGAEGSTGVQVTSSVSQTDDKRADAGRDSRNRLSPDVSANQAEGIESAVAGVSPNELLSPSDTGFENEDPQDALVSSGAETQSNSDSTTPVVTADAASIPSVPADDSAIIDRIDELLAKSWEENGVIAAPESADSEWLRRAYLTFAGRIPSADECRRYYAATGDRRRRMLVEELLSDVRTAENLSVMWVNLLIGRSNPRGVNQEALQAFLMDRFQKNEPWIGMVGELIAAEGRSDQNGATNFLLAHLNDQATPATAVTARLFFGQQVHCTQCHDHPFSRDVKQDQFWALNAFFKQTSREMIKVSLPDGTQKDVWKLADSTGGGMTFYETLRGQQKAVLPEFAGHRLTAAEGIDRRDELVRLLKTDPDRRVAQAMVNRMWNHFFGAGFTAPVDDMGPHVTVSHPELLSYLTDVFVQSGYDTKRLMMWIALSDAWHRTSSTNFAGGDAVVEQDNPQTGTEPLFTRVYPRYMVPEQLYDSIRVAIRSVSGQPMESSLGTQHRTEWVKQFVESFGTDDNDERLQFDGNISQALLMMNGEDLEQAIALAVHSLVVPAAGKRRTGSECLEQMAMSVLSRKPSESEERAFRNRQRTLVRTLSVEKAMELALEDMLWAYLNSAEFIAVH
jgi:hypothetical protein